MTIPLTRELGAFIAGSATRPLPGAVLATVRSAFADTVCVAIAGAGEAAPTLLRRVLSPAGGDALLLGSSERAGALDAAWINGTAAHALDFDDLAERGGHVSAVLVPAVLAEAEALGASGAAMARAYAVGVETLGELAWRDRDSHHGKGWHPTPVFGAIGAAAACASLRGFAAHECAMAIAIAASQAGGVMSNVGTMTKPFHAGRAAHAGLVSARLAADGFTGAPDALEHSAGFLAAISPAGRYDVESPLVAGRRWQLAEDCRLGVKKYPLCFFAHRAADALLDLLEAHPVEAADVEHVTVGMGGPNAEVLRYHRPQTGLEAKFSMQFAMACGLVARRLSLAEFTDAFVQRADVQALMKRVHVQPLPEDARKPGYSVHDRVEIVTRSGRRLDSGPVTRLRGSAEVPLTRADLWAKFAGCLAVGNPRIDAAALFDALMAIEAVPTARDLARLMTPA